MTKKSMHWNGCPIRYSAGIIGDKWTMLIIRDLLFKGKKYYGEFMDEDEYIATNILADRLQKLEEKGIVSKSRDPVKKSRIIYGVTEKGIELVPVLLQMMSWSEKYDPDSDVPKSFIKEFRKSPESFAADIMLNLKKTLE